MQPHTTFFRLPDQPVPADQRLVRSRPLRSTAAILRRGVTLAEVQEAVRQLKPYIQEHK